MTDKMYAESRPRKSDGGTSSPKTFTMLFVLILLLGIAGVWMHLQNRQTGANLDTRLLGIEQNQSLIKEALKLTGENFSDVEIERRTSFDSLAKDLGKANAEILKLWNLANGRNKKWLITLESELGKTGNGLKKLEGASNDRFAQLNKQLGQLAVELSKLVETQAALSGRITSLETQRSANNTRLVRMQENVNLLRRRMLTLENNLTLPTNITESAQ